MKHIHLYLGMLLLATLTMWSCDTTVDSNGAPDQNLAAQLNAGNNNSSVISCQSAGDTGKTAVYVNESVNGATINFTNHSCDMAIYFDENAPKNATVRNVTVIQQTGGSGRVTGLLNEGADITVTRSTFITDFAGEYVPIRFVAGAQGTISNNELSGSHRSGIVIRGEGSSVQVKGNTVTGTGAKTSGWAENGIQVDQGATADITNNEISEHWWDGESNFASTGLILFGSDSKTTNNTLHNNEFSIYLFGENNKVTGNETTSDIDSQSSFGFKAYGALVAGVDNHLAGNSFSASEGTGAIGVYIFPGTSYSKVTGNRISGFSLALFDGGDDSMIRGTPVSPSNL